MSSKVQLVYVSVSYNVPNKAEKCYIYMNIKLFTCYSGLWADAVTNIPPYSPTLPPSHPPLRSPMVSVGVGLGYFKLGVLHTRQISLKWSFQITMILGMQSVIHVFMLYFMFIYINQIITQQVLIWLSSTAGVRFIDQY